MRDMWRVGVWIGVFAASSTAWAVNGVDLPLRSNGGNPAATTDWRLDDNGYVGTYITLAAPGSVTVTVNAVGQTAGTGERMNIVIGDARMGWDVGTSDTDYAHTFDLPAGTHFVRTEYANAHLGQSLTINTLDVSGATILPTSNTANALAAAQTYTQNYRKGNATIQLPDGWSGHSFQVKLKRHAFNFGAGVPDSFGGTLLAPNPTPTSDAGRFQQALRDNRINSLTPENAGKWSSNENTRDVLTANVNNPNGGPQIPYMDRIADYAQENGMRYRAHNVIWGRNPQGNVTQQPGWSDSMLQNPTLVDATSGKVNSEALRDEISERIDYYIADRAADMYEVDVYNESYHTGSNQNHATNTYWDVYQTAGIASIYKEAKDAAGPNVKVMVNEYSVLQNQGGDFYANWYVRHIEQIQNAGRAAYGEEVVTGIGFQYYAPTNLSSHSAARIYATMQNMAVQGLPMHLTEWGVTGTDSPTNEANAATILEETTRLVFGMPGTTGMTLWNLRNVPGVFAPVGTLYDNNWTIRDPGTRWQQLMAEWNTDLVVNVSPDGTFDFNGFYGDYELIVGNQTFPLTLVKGTAEYELNAPPPNPADFNADGKVDNADLGIWQTNFGMHELALHAQGDADLDGDVDGDDWMTWQQNYGTGVPAPGATVPEPSSCLLAAGMAIAIAGFRRRRRGFCSPRAVVSRRPRG